MRNGGCVNTKVRLNVKMKLDEIKTTPKDPNERFRFNGRSLDFKLIDFWTWNQSDLIENRNRGILAEFLVRQALGLDYPTRLEWDAFDLITADGLKIEIKSAAYIQAWKQKKYSSISFDIKPTKTLLADNNYSSESNRQSDIYVFCLLHHQDQDTIDPMNLDQWTFYLTTTEILNRTLPEQKSISISTIETIQHEKCTFTELSEVFEKIKKSMPNKTYKQ
jgi:hypothetical protein